MKLSAVAAVLGLATPVFSQTYTLLYDTLYDGTQTQFLHNVACSTGPNGLITYGYNTMGEIPTYPNLGGAPQVEGYNSIYCGSCWDLTYTDSRGESSSVTYTAVNSGNGADGYSMSFAGMDSFTNGNAEVFGIVSITASELPRSACGM